MKEAPIEVRAPSNIALAKYMGKRPAEPGDDKQPATSGDGKREGNLPANASLSLTLREKCTFVELARVEDASSAPVAAADARILWEPALPGAASGRSGARVPELGEAGLRRVIHHFERVEAALPGILRRHLGAPDAEVRAPSVWRLRTANTFAASAGVASSASAFAALTLAAAARGARERGLEAPFWERYHAADPGLRRALASVSREGSGSSCRSFEGPWVRWSDARSEAVPVSGIPPVAHFLLEVSAEAKAVGSTEAHARVRGSPLWSGRPGRADAREARIRIALGEGRWEDVARETWAEAWEMHSLFHTAVPPFSYWRPETLRILAAFGPVLAAERGSAVPIVTLDAGPNVHVVVPESAAPRWRAWFAESLPGIPWSEDREGPGAERVIGAAGAER